MLCMGEPHPPPKVVPLPPQGRLYHEAFVEPSKRYADIIVPVGGENAVACQMIIDQIDKHLK